MYDRDYHYYALWLVLICVVMFALQAIYPATTDSFVLISEDAIARPWTLITSIFLHRGVGHLFWNMFALALFGSILEKIIGSKRFLISFFISGFFASIGAALFYSATLGASGAIFGILGCLAVLRPRMVIWVLPIGIPMPMFVAVIVWLFIDLIGIFYPTSIASAAHIAGLVVGVVTGFLLRRKHRTKRKKEEQKKLVSEREIDEWEKEWMKLRNGMT